MNSSKTIGLSQTQSVTIYFLKLSISTSYFSNPIGSYVTNNRFTLYIEREGERFIKAYVLFIQYKIP